MACLQATILDRIKWNSKHQHSRNQGSSRTKAKSRGVKFSICISYKVVTCMAVVLGSPKAAKETQRFKEEETCKG